MPNLAQLRIGTAWPPSSCALPCSLTVLCAAGQRLAMEEVSRCWHCLECCVRACGGAQAAGLPCPAPSRTLCCIALLWEGARQPLASGFPEPDLHSRVMRTCSRQRLTWPLGAGQGGADACLQELHLRAWAWPDPACSACAPSAGAQAVLSLHRDFWRASEHPLCSCGVLSPSAIAMRPQPALSKLAQQMRDILQLRLPVQPGLEQGLSAAGQRVCWPGHGWASLLWRSP